MDEELFAYIGPEQRSLESHLRKKRCKVLFKIRTQLRSGKTRCGRALQEQELISLRAQELEMVKELCPRMATSSTTRTRFWMRRRWRATRAHTATLATVARGAATKRVEQEDDEEEKRQAEPEVTTQDEAIDLLDGPGSRWGPIETARDSYDDSKFVDHQPLVGPVEGDRHPLLLSENLGVEPGTDLLDGPGSWWDPIEMACDCYDVSKLKDYMPLEGPEGEGRPLPAGQDAALPALDEQAGEQISCKNTSGWSDAKRQKFGA